MQCSLDGHVSFTFLLFINNWPHLKAISTFYQYDQLPIIGSLTSQMR